MIHALTSEGSLNDLEVKKEYLLKRITVSSTSRYHVSNKQSTVQGYCVASKQRGFY